MKDAPINVLTFTTLYPNAEQPTHGIFVENRITQLIRKYPQVSVSIVAPVPWFPFKSRIFGRYAMYARIPRVEDRNGLRVLHPRFLAVPKIGTSLAPLLMFMSLFFTVRRIIRDPANRFHVMDAHYFYPDGVAAVMLCRLLRLPVLVTARGTDINLIPKWRVPRFQLRWAFRHADAIVAVCQALNEAIQLISKDTARVEVLRNGVDLEFFAPPTDRARLRAELGFEKLTLLCVGHLIERKGPHLAIEAVSHFDDVDLVLVGDGELRDSLASQVKSLELEGRVRFVGALEQGELKKYYQAADFLVLASSREGWANVLLEAMACGTPVIATRVWGTPEAVEDGLSGLLVDSRTSRAIAQTIDAARRISFDRNAVRRWAERFSWDETSDGLWRILDNVARGVSSERLPR